MNRRKDYVTDCLFCKISAGEIPSNIVYQDDDILAFYDIQPQAKYHILLIPRQHIATSLNDIEPEDTSILFKILTTARDIAHNLGIDQNGYRLVTNSGPNAGQSVFHLHFHLLGGETLGIFGAPIYRSGIE